MIVEECSPVLGRWLVVAEHVLRDRGLRDDDSDHLKFPVYMSSAPERILARELADKAADLRGSRGPACAPTASRFPRPVSAEALLVPAEQRVRLEHSNRGETAGPEPVQPNPEEALVTAGSEPFVVPGGDHCQLLTKRQDLQMEEAATTEQASQGKEQRGRSVFIARTLALEKRKSQRDPSVRRFR